MRRADDVVEFWFVATDWLCCGQGTRKVREGENARTGWGAWGVGPGTARRQGRCCSQVGNSRFSVADAPRAAAATQRISSLAGLPQWQRGLVPALQDARFAAEGCRCQIRTGLGRSHCAAGAGAGGSGILVCIHHPHALSQMLPCRYLGRL